MAAICVLGSKLIRISKIFGDFAVRPNNHKIKMIELSRIESAGRGYLVSFVV